MSLSPEVFERAHALQKKYCFIAIHIGNITPLPDARMDVVKEIILLERGLEITQKLQGSYRATMLHCQTRDEAQMQILAKAGIVDDRTANEYLDAIDLRYAPLLQAEKDMEARHRQEREDFRASLP